MSDNNKRGKPICNWDKMVHAPFKKVVKFDLICMGLGVMMGIGLGAFVVKEVIGVG